MRNIIFSTALAMLLVEPRITAGGDTCYERTLLVCGILSSLLYVAMTIFVAMQWEGYSSISQTISELSAIGAPTRSLGLSRARCTRYP